MPQLRRTYNEFITSVRMSRLPQILLEGSQDKVFFLRMCEATKSVEHDPVGGQSRCIITTAEELMSEVAGVGNRTKVERVCELIADWPFRRRFIGFVDREFRGFTFGEVVNDGLRSHNCRDRLVWSRGHSIENYLFDFGLIRESLCDFCPDQQIAEEALEVLRDNFPEVLNIACALGLAARELDHLKTVRGTVHWKTLQLSESECRWDTDKWRASLVQHSHLSCEASGQLVSQFERWHESSRCSRPDDVRWACDGHIGFKLIWVAYARAVYEISKAKAVVGVSPTPNNQRDTILRTDDRVKFNHLARSWARVKAHDSVESPSFCLDLVGLAVS